jgi:hypothetical protein
VKYKYTKGLPYAELKKFIKNEKVDELWLAFAYFSSNRVLEILNLVKDRKKTAIVNVIFSSASVNPLQEIVDDIIYMTTFPYFKFSLVETPLMHAKLFAAKTEDQISIYLGSGNLTNKAIKSNIETGIFLNFDNSKKSIEYINDLSQTCQAENSVENIIRKSMYSHFHNELLFLALEESKVRQSIAISPYSVKKIISGSRDSVQQNEDKTVNIKTKRSLNIFILNDDDRNLLLIKEKTLKNEIKKHFAVKLDSYGWVSSLWSLKHINDKEHPINKVYTDFLESLEKVREQYKNIEYRRLHSDQIAKYIHEWIDEENIILSENQKNSIKTFLGKFYLEVDNRNSPYKKIERLCNKIKDYSNITSLLNPYKIGDDETREENSEFDILSSDQVNLLVMCELAIKLRTKKPPKIPCVWWFDMGLDNNIHDCYGYESISIYKETTRMQLESIISEIQEASNSSELDYCMDRYCEITGFNLALKYPITSELLVWMDDGDSLADGPYAFIGSSKSRYNFGLPKNAVSEEVMISFDVQKIPNDWELEESYLTKIKGKFVLGNNLGFYFNESTSSITYLYANSLRPKNIS